MNQIEDADETQQADSTDEPHNPLHELTGFQRDVLVIAYREGPCNGQDIKSVYDAATGKSVNHGRLYPNIDTLVGRGLIDKSPRKPDLRSNTYEITDRGLDALVSYNDWITGGDA